MYWGLIIPIIILILITGCGIAICYFFVSRFKRIRAKILISFLIFGLLIGCFSFWMGKTDFVAMINFPGSEISEIVYNDYLLPYWRSTLEPIGYEQMPIIDLQTGETMGIKDVPRYNFPLKKVSDLYMPVSLLFWGLLGLVIQLIYNLRKRNKNLP